MPKATAMWLIDNTTLTFAQISNENLKSPVWSHSKASFGTESSWSIGIDPKVQTNGEVNIFLKAANSTSLLYRIQ